MAPVASFRQRFCPYKIQIGQKCPPMAKSISHCRGSPEAQERQRTGMQKITPSQAIPKLHRIQDFTTRRRTVR